MTTTLIINGEEKELTLREMCEEHNKLWQYIVNARNTGDKRGVEDIKAEYLSNNNILDCSGYDLLNHCFLCEYTSNYDCHQSSPFCDMCPKTWTEEIDRNGWGITEIKIEVNNKESVDK